MMPVPVGPEPPPQYVRIPADVAAGIRRTCARTGAALITSGAALGVLLVLLAPRLGASSSASGPIIALVGVLTALFLCILGVAVAGARRYVTAQAIDVAGAAPLRHVLVVLTVAVWACAGLAALLVFALATAGQLGYLALVAACPVLATLGTALTARRLRPPPMRPHR